MNLGGAVLPRTETVNELIALRQWAEEARMRGLTRCHDPFPSFPLLWWHLCLRFQSRQTSS